MRCAAQGTVAKGEKERSDTSRARAHKRSSETGAWTKSPSLRLARFFAVPIISSMLAVIAAGCLSATFLSPAAPAMLSATFLSPAAPAIAMLRRPELSALRARDISMAHASTKLKSGGVGFATSASAGATQAKLVAIQAELARAKRSISKLKATNSNVHATLSENSKLLTTLSRQQQIHRKHSSIEVTTHTATEKDMTASIKVVHY